MGGDGGVVMMEEVMVEMTVRMRMKMRMKMRKMSKMSKMRRPVILRKMKKNRNLRIGTTLNTFMVYNSRHHLMMNLLISIWITVMKLGAIVGYLRAQGRKNKTNRTGRNKITLIRIPSPRIRKQKQTIRIVMEKRTTLLQEKIQRRTYLFRHLQITQLLPKKITTRKKKDSPNFG